MDNLSQITNGMSDRRDGSAVQAAAKPLYDKMRSQNLTSAGLVITATSGKKLPKTGASITYGVYKGKFYTIAAGTDMPALAGTVTNAAFNVFCFFAGASGAITATSMTSAMGTEGATLAAVKFPPFPEGKPLIGILIVNPTGTGNFVGDTTALDDATVVPNAVYLSPVGAFDPSASY